VAELRGHYYSAQLVHPEFLIHYWIGLYQFVAYYGLQFALAVEESMVQQSFN